MRFKYDRETDTVTLPGKWWRAIAATHRVAVHDGKRSLEPGTTPYNCLTELLLETCEFPKDEIDEFFGVMESPFNGASRRA